MTLRASHVEKLHRARELYVDMWTCSHFTHMLHVHRGAGLCPLFEPIEI